MCGIVGTFNLDSDMAAPTDDVRAAMDVMKLRGPDDHGLFAGPGVALGHRRLAIIDLHAGKQPLIDRASGAVIVFNGEIYNCRELRETLSRAGRIFRTMSDTEVLLQAYLEWGVAALDKLSGMYAFAIYEPQKQQLFLARDRVGVKPLFYAVRGGRFFFASSMAALLCFHDVEAKMDLAAVSHYLTTVRTTLGARTLIENVNALQPAEYITARHGSTNVQPVRYWDFPVIAPGDKNDPGLDVAAGRTLELMTQSVREQLISDVPLGGFLSGGLDSSVIASLANGLSGNNFNAYSVGYDMEGYHEWPFVRAATAFHGMKCQEVHLDASGYAATWKFLVGQKGLPVSTPNEIPIYHLARALRSDYTVALSGEGADEVFGGYVVPYFSSFDYDRALHADPGASATLSHVDKVIQRLYRRPYLSCHADQFFALNSWVSFRQKQALLAGDCLRQLDGDDAMCSHYEDLFTKFAACSTFDKHMHVHARVNLEGLLFRVDSSTMAASVEGRVPYTDHRLVDYIFRLPDTYKINWASPEAEAMGRNRNIKEIDRDNLVESKILLRRAFASSVPPEILRRPKMSFPVPVREWFGNELNSFVHEVLESSYLVGTVFNPGIVKRLLETSSLPDSGSMLWPVVNLCFWHRWLADANGRSNHAALHSYAGSEAGVV